MFPISKMAEPSAWSSTPILQRICRSSVGRRPSSRNPSGLTNSMYRQLQDALSPVSYSERWSSAPVKAFPVASSLSHALQSTSINSGNTFNSVWQIPPHDVMGTSVASDHYVHACT